MKRKKQILKELGIDFDERGRNETDPVYLSILDHIINRPRQNNSIVTANKPMKLSKAQKEVIQKMREGREMRYSYKYCWVGGLNEIKWVIARSLDKKSLIEKSGLNVYPTQYQLTNLGKTIPL